MRAILLVSHGSQLSETKEEVGVLIDVLKTKTAVPLLEYAFLEIESPNIPDGIRNCVRKGATEICVLLNFLNSGRHVERDIPAIIEECRREFPDVKMVISRPIGQHPGISELFLDLIDYS